MKHITYAIHIKRYVIHSFKNNRTLNLETIKLDIIGIAHLFEDFRIKKKMFFILKFSQYNI